MQTQDIYWQALGVPGLEHLVIKESDRGLEADGFVIRNHSGSALRLRYALRYDTEWNPLELRVDSQLDGTHLHILADSGHWLDERQHELPAVRGCTDIDIMATPFTNTPAVRRLGLRPGESHDITALFVRIPTLTIEVHRQRYTCLDASPTGSHYRYENLESGFHALLTLDDAQLVTTYEGVWQRV